MIIEDIVSQHAEEAAFLWLLRANAIKAPHYDLKDLMALEERVEAHLDGLRVAGEEGWPFCEDGLKQGEIGEVFAAGFIALDTSRDDWLTPVIETVAAAPETLPGLVSALGWVEREKLQGRVINWLKSDDPLHRQLGLGACTAQGVDCGSYLEQAVSDGDPLIRARALRNAGVIRRQDLLPNVLGSLDHDDPACRFQAAWSTTLLGDRQGLPVLQQAVLDGGSMGGAALQLLLRAMEQPEAVDWVRELNAEADAERAVVQATGIIGDPVSIPWLIEQMSVPALARVAGEAFSLIVGVDLAYDDLEADWPEGFEAGPTEDPQDEDVAMDADEDLPWPAPEALAQWWIDHQGDYRIGVQYLCGKPIDQSQCARVLQQGMQRQRQAAALELALLNPTAPLFNVAAPAKRQMHLLGLR